MATAGDKEYRFPVPLYSVDCSDFVSIKTKCGGGGGTQPNGQLFFASHLAVLGSNLDSGFFTEVVELIDSAWAVTFIMLKELNKYCGKLVL